VREDPKTRGLLFAGSENEVFVSFDDGEHWQSLRLNMPATSIRDLIVKDDDVAVATHGRGFWILDDIEPLRQARSSNALLQPQRAWRVRWNKNTDTPLPADEPTGENPPDGAILDYVLSAKASLVTLEILDSDDKLVRRYSSNDAITPPRDTGQVPAYWIRPQRALSTAAGMHRFMWDLRYPPIERERPSYPIAAVPRNTAPTPTSPVAMPGTYTVRLTVDGKTSTQPLVVEMDPRVKTPREGLAEQFRLSMKVYGLLQKLPENSPHRASAARLFDMLQSSDTAPTTQLVTAVEELHGSAVAAPPL